MVHNLATLKRSDICRAGAFLLAGSTTAGVKVKLSCMFIGVTES